VVGRDGVQGLYDTPEAQRELRRALRLRNERGQFAQRRHNAAHPSGGPDVPAEATPDHPRPDHPPAGGRDGQSFRGSLQLPGDLMAQRVTFWFGILGALSRFARRER
jgi:hypothetical protein